METSLKNGTACTVEDIHASKTGPVTITVRLSDGDRIKTLAKNVVAKP